MEPILVQVHFSKLQVLFRCVSEQNIAPHVLSLHGQPPVRELLVLSLVKGLKI